MRAPQFNKNYVRACLWVLILIGIISVWRVVSFFNSSDPSSFYLSLSLRSPKGGVAALYYDLGQGFNEKHMVSVHIGGGYEVHEYLFKMPTGTIYNLRWDPPTVPNDVISIQKLEILDGSRKLLRRLNLRQLEPLHQTRLVALSDAKADFQVLEEADDPQIKIRLESPLSVKKVDYPFVAAGRFFLEFLGVFLMTCLLLFFWLRRKDKVVATVIALSLIIFGWRCWTLYKDAGYLFLQMSMSSSVDSTSQVFFNLGQGMNEDQSQRGYTNGRETLQRHRFKLPNKTIYDIRLDPLTTAGKVQIKEMKVVDASGNLLREIPLQQLEPLNQIASISIKEEGAEILIPEGANDPQIAIRLKDALDFEGKLPFPLRQWLMALIGETVLLGLFAFVFFLIWKKREDVLVILDSPFIQRQLPLVYLGTAFGLILAMGFISGLDVHPDEWNGHIKAAAYYIENWLPPAVDDPRVENSISVFGISYLWHIDPYYFLAVKATQVLSGIVNDFYLRMRLANALLFLSLVLLVITRMRRLKWVVPFLVISPQMWYVFSYFNNDAFPLSIAIVLAIQIVDPESSLNRFLSAMTIRHQIGRGIFVGVLIGLLLSSKLNYRLYIAFLIFLGSWNILFEAPLIQRTRQIRKWIFLFFVALLVYLPLYGHDQYVNNFQKDEKISIALERYAVFQFKPSTLEKDLSSSYPGLRLKDKGVSFYDLFIRNPDWRDMSFMSFFGVYGYMDLVSSSGYYQAVTYVLGLFSLLILFYAAITLSRRDVIFLLIVVLFFGLTIGQSVYHSWINDYQPQGRYLFLMLPMLMVGLAKFPSSFRERVMPVAGFVFFMLSVWSFLLTGLKMIPKIG